MTFQPRVLEPCGRQAAVWLLAIAAASRVSADQPTPDLAAGRALYVQHCARCHGDQGRGDGVDAKRFYPRPRDLSMGVYKFRSTVSGTPPTDEDLFHTITQGLPGSNMPDWKHLDEASRWQLVYYLKSLSLLFQQATPESVTVAPDPSTSGVDPAKGRALYEQLGCASCHGPHGRANGTSAAGLVDDWGKPIRPANLTKRWNYRGSADARSVMMRVLTGIDGAGMPSYAGALSAEDAWQLAYYVTSLQEPVHWNLITHATYLRDALPKTVDDPRWAQAERTDVRTRNAVDPSGEWGEAPTITSIAFQMLYNDEAIALRIMWDDPTRDPQPTDASASTAAPPSPDRLAVFLRPDGVEGDTVTLQAWPYAGAPALEACAWSSQNDRTVDVVTQELDGLTQSSASSPQLRSASSYADGRWHVVIERALQPAQRAEAAAIRADVFNPIAFAVWDGGNPTARAVSTWIDVALGPGTPAKRHANESSSHQK